MGVILGLYGGNIGFPAHEGLGKVGFQIAVALNDLRKRPG